MPDSISPRLPAVAWSPAPGSRPGVPPDAPPAIEVSGVAKAFGDVTALAGVDLTVAAGSLTALLGPNGAGKTTLVRIIATLTRPDRGRVAVLGADALAQPALVRARIGLTGQFAGLDDELSGWDNLILIGRLAGLPRHAARARAGEVAETFGLTDALRRMARSYSGGMRRRLDLAASLMSRPALLVLDEPTTGLDPAGRRQLWEVLSGLRAHGTAMLLTTQYLEEADAFADTVHLLDHGKVTASATPTQLKSLVGGQVVEVCLSDPAAAPSAERALARRLPLPPGSVQAGPTPGRLTIAAGEGADAVLTVAGALRAEGFALTDVGLRQPSLDEAFLTLTSAPRVPA